MPDIVTAAALVAVIGQTGALFYWGGALHQMLKDHERRLSRLEGP
jgi:hypothetical protein